MTARAIADAIRASLESALTQLPAGTTVADALSSGAITAAANNAAAGVITDPVAMMVAALGQLDGARSVLITPFGDHASVDVVCIGEATCCDLAVTLGVESPEIRRGNYVAWVTQARQDGTSVLISTTIAAAASKEAA